MKNLDDEIIKELEESIEVKNNFKSQARIINKIAELLIDSINNNGVIYLMGNGGSASDAQHIAGELVGRFSSKISRKGLPAIALTTNTSIITAIGNDISFDEIFSRQVESCVKPADVVIGISTSGKSKNIISAIRLSKKLGAKTIAFTGMQKGVLTKLADISLMVPSVNTQRIQECHITAGHIICGLVEQAFSKN